MAHLFKIGTFHWQLSSLPQKGASLQGCMAFSQPDAVERLWRSVKHEDVYLKGYDTLPELLLGLTEYFVFYNTERTHQSLDYDTPDQIYRTGSGGGARIVDKFSTTEKPLLEIEAKNRDSAVQLHEVGAPLKHDVL